MQCGSTSNGGRISASHGSAFQSAPRRLKTRTATISGRSWSWRSQPSSVTSGCSRYLSVMIVLIFRLIRFAPLGADHGSPRRPYDPAGLSTPSPNPSPRRAPFCRPQCRRTADNGQDGQKPLVRRLSQPADFAGSRQAERRRSKRNDSGNDATGDYAGVLNDGDPSVLGEGSIENEFADH